MGRRQTVPGAYHARDGWHFKRGEGGTVTIYSGDGDQELMVEPSTWASIVAAVSAPGETGPTYRHALAFHLGDLL
jgi:hypothetical protein